MLHCSSKTDAHYECFRNTEALCVVHSIDLRSFFL